MRTVYSLLSNAGCSKRLLVTGAALTLTASVWVIPLADAHHNFRVAYDFSQTQTLEGRVARWELVNPHMRLYIDVTTESGETEQWLVEGPGKLALARRGWTDDTFTGNELISVAGNPSASGDLAIWLERIVLADGTELIDPLVSDALAIEEERRERVRRLREQSDGATP